MIYNQDEYNKIHNSVLMRFKYGDDELEKIKNEKKDKDEEKEKSNE